MMNLPDQKNYRLTIFHERLLENEHLCYQTLAQIIIYYPLIWNNFINNIIAVKAFVVTSEGLVIINKSLLDERQIKILDFIWNKIKNINIFEEIISSKEFKIYTCKSRKIIRLFEGNVWLESLVYYLCKENNIEFFINPIIINQNLQSDLINVYIKYQEKNFLIKIGNKRINPDKYYNTSIIYISNNTQADIIYNFDYIKFCKDIMFYLEQ